MTHPGKRGVIQFDQGPQLVVGISVFHGLLNFMVEKPCRIVTQTEFATQRPCGFAPFVDRNQENGYKPYSRRATLVRWKSVPAVRDA